MANPPHATGRVAVLMHLARHDLWEELAAALSHLPVPFTLLVNLVRDLHAPSELEVQRRRITSRIPGAIVIVSPNRGLDVGGTFYLMSELFRREIPFDHVLKLHGKSDPRWRAVMLDRLLGSERRCGRILDSFARDPRLGMVGSYFHPFDYMNLSFVLDYLERFGVALEVGWDAYRRAYPETVGRSPAALIAHREERRLGPARPAIDLEYYAAHVGDYRDTSRQPGPEARRRMRALGVMGQLPYYPGTCFWMRGALLEHLFAGRDVIALAEELEAGWVSDTRRQTRTHAWERIYTMLAEAHGYELAAVGEDA